MLAAFLHAGTRIFGLSHGVLCKPLYYREYAHRITPLPVSASLTRKLRQAEERLRSGDAAGAEWLCEEVLQRAPRNPDALCLLGLTRLATGRAGDAVPPLQQAVSASPDHGAALEHLGLAHLLLGQFAQAESVLRDAAALRAAPASVFMRLGAAMLHQGRPAEALPALQRAVALDPQSAECHLNLGQALARTGDPAAARVEFETVLRLDPGHADAQFNLGVICLERGELDGARQWFERVLAQSPEHADALVNLGVVLQRQSHLDQAAACLRKALALDPGNAAAGNNLARTLALQGKLEPAREQYLTALRAAPGFTAAHEGLASVCLALGRVGEAIGHLRATLQAEPDNRDALSALAGALFEAGQLDEAEAAARRVCGSLSPPEMVDKPIPPFIPPLPSQSLIPALLPSGEGGLEPSSLPPGEREGVRAGGEGVRDERREPSTQSSRDPSAAVSYATLANVCIVRGELDRAIAALESGYAQTGGSSLLGMLAYQFRQACDWTKWQAAWDKMAPEIERSGALGSPFWLLCEPTAAQQQLAYTRRWAESRFRSITPGSHGAGIAPRRHPRRRIGYLSSDLQEHAAAYLIAEVLELHDRERFEVFAYSHGPDDQGAMRRRLRAACEHFIDIAWEPDDVAAERIRADELDVLVDLKGYTAGDRLTIMARRPCDAQVTWLGYPGTTGAAFIDYLIADAFIIPPERESAYSERVVCLPHCYQPNDRKRVVAETLPRADYGIPDRAFVFCCFNQTYKITPDVFAVWMRLLRNVPGSVLWLVESNRWAKRNLIETAQTHGVAAERLVFAPRLPYAEHLARYRVADLALDTFPYTSHTILSDALWCGCPTVGLCGETFASRVSGTLLTAAGMPDLVTYTLSDYEQFAFRLATEPSLLRELRARVAQARDGSPLFDSTAFTRDLERLYFGLANHAMS